jgi:hypothetical protein
MNRALFDYSADEAFLFIYENRDMFPAREGDIITVAIEGDAEDTWTTGVSRLSEIRLPDDAIARQLRATAASGRIPVLMMHNAGSDVFIRTGSVGPRRRDDAPPLN